MPRAATTHCGTGSATDQSGRDAAPLTTNWAGSVTTVGTDPAQNVGPSTAGPRQGRTRLGLEAPVRAAGLRSSVRPEAGARPGQRDRARRRVLEEPRL